MTWTDFIHADPAIAAGKPVVKGTPSGRGLPDGAFRQRLDPGRGAPGLPSPYA